MPKKYRVDKEPERNAPIFAKRLIEELNKKQMTQSELSKISGQSEATISGWLGKTIGDEIRYSEPQAKALVAVAKALKVSLDYLLGLSPNSTVNEEVKNVCAVTGLDEEPVYKIQGFAAPPTKQVFEAIITSDEFSSIITTLADCAEVDHNVYGKLKDGQGNPTVEIIKGDIEPEYMFDGATYFNLRNVFRADYDAWAKLMFDSVVDKLKPIKLRKICATIKFPIISSEQDLEQAQAWLDAQQEQHGKGEENG